MTQIYQQQNVYINTIIHHPKTKCNGTQNASDHEL